MLFGPQAPPAGSLGATNSLCLGIETKSSHDGRIASSQVRVRPSNNGDYFSQFKEKSTETLYLSSGTSPY